MTDQNPPEQGSFGDAGSEPPAYGQHAQSEHYGQSEQYEQYGQYGQAADPTTPIPAPSTSQSPDPRSPNPQSPLQSARGVAEDTTGFLPALFDFSFTHFVTPKLVRFVYLLATIALAVMWLFWLFVGFSRGAGAGFAVLVLGPVLLVIYLAVIRMTLEFYLSIVRMSEDVHKRLPQA